MRKVCVTIKKNKVNKLPYIQIRLFTAKGNEAMKQVAYVNYTLNEFKELSQILGDLMIMIIELGYLSKSQTIHSILSKLTKNTNQISNKLPIFVEQTKKQKFLITPFIKV